MRNEFVRRVVDRKRPAALSEAIRKLKDGQGRYLWQQNANSGYGRPSDGILPNLPKKIVNTAIVASGCSSAHATPSAVCR